MFLIFHGGSLGLDLHELEIEEKKPIEIVFIGTKIKKKNIIIQIIPNNQGFELKALKNMIRSAKIYTLKPLKYAYKNKKLAFYIFLIEY